MDSLAESAPLQSDFVLAEDFRFSRTHGHRVRQHVLRHHAVAADKGVLPNPAKLMHAAKRLNHRPIFHDYVPCERHGISELRVIANPHIVRHVCIRHQQIVVADLRDQTAAFGAAVDADKFADLIPAPDARLRALSFVFQILRRHSDGGIGIENVVFADVRDALPRTRAPSGASELRFLHPRR